MKLTAHLQTNTMRFVQSRSPRVFVPDMIRAAQERYRFWRVPTSMAEYGQPTGAEFQTGLFDGTILDVVRIHGNGVFAEGFTSTDSLDAFVDDAIGWLNEEFGLQFENLEPVARGYTSAVEVQFRAGAEKFLDGLSGVAGHLSSMLAGYGLSIAPYEFNSVIATTDAALATPVQPGRFVFDRRAKTPYTSDLFYSEAPVSTAQHLELLEMLEAIFSNG